MSNSSWARTTPGAPAVTTCCIFIASSTSTSWPASTVAPGATLRATMVPCIGARSAIVPSGPATSSGEVSADGTGASLLP